MARARGRDLARGRARPQYWAWRRLRQAVISQSGRIRRRRKLQMAMADLGPLDLHRWRMGLHPVEASDGRWSYRMSWCVPRPCDGMECVEGWWSNCGKTKVALIQLGCAAACNSVPRIVLFVRFVTMSSFEIVHEVLRMGVHVQRLLLFSPHVIRCRG